MKYVYIFLTTILFFGITNLAFAAGVDDFVITVESNITNTFTVPTTGGGYNYNIDCNDDGVDEVTAVTGNFTCDYSALGVVGDAYTIRIEDNSGVGTGFPRIYFNNAGDKDNVLSLDQWGTGQWTSMDSAFSGATRMTVPATDVPNLSNVTDVSFMFFNAVMANPDTTNWNVTTITDMGSMFRNATSATPNTTNWSVDNVEIMTSMFLSATSANPNVSNWNTGNVRLMNAMFSLATSATPNTSNWDTAMVTNMSLMFNGAILANPDTSNWITSNVTLMNSMFLDAASANPDVSNWNTELVTRMDLMFSGATLANPDVTNWDTGMVFNMSAMFQDAISFDRNVGSFDVTSLGNAASMFNGVTLSVSNYDALLTDWNAQTLRTGVSFDGGDSLYCLSGDERENMITIDGWNISDGGLCPDTDGDLVPDHSENTDGTLINDPTDYTDTDGDLVPDYVEINIEMTDENDMSDFLDTDTGGVPDYVEVILFPNEGLAATDENVAADDVQDTDGDGTSDYIELKNGNDPLIFDVVVDTGSRGPSKKKNPETGKVLTQNELDILFGKASTLESNPFNGVLCQPDEIISQNMKDGDTDGRFGNYENGIVTEIHLLQGHINRLLGDEYEQAAGPIDGYFRNLTKQGVERLQRRLNSLLPDMVPLVIDGIVGPFTRWAINNSCEIDELRN